MRIEPLSIPGALLITPEVHTDDRGEFLELYRLDGLREVTGHVFPLQQVNLSSSKRRVVRGIHYTTERYGQDKYVTCVQGGVEDYVVDLRIGSPAFGRHEKVLLDPFSRHALYLPAGLGHAICALEDDSTLMYLCTKAYNPATEKEIWPLDPDIGLDFRYDHGTVILSAKDAAAPRLEEARKRGLLPDYVIRSKV